MDLIARILEDRWCVVRWWLWIAVCVGVWLRVCVYVRAADEQGDLMPCDPDWAEAVMCVSGCSFWCVIPRCTADTSGYTVFTFTPQMHRHSLVLKDMYEKKTTYHHLPAVLFPDNLSVLSFSSLSTSSCPSSPHTSPHSVDLPQKGLIPVTALSHILHPRSVCRMPGWRVWGEAWVKTEGFLRIAVTFATEDSQRFSFLLFCFPKRPASRIHLTFQIRKRNWDQIYLDSLYDKSQLFPVCLKLKTGNSQSCIRSF